MKKLKILICNSRFYSLSGTETFTYTISSELQKRGHEVVVFSPYLGNIALKVQERGVKVVNALLEEDDEMFDCVILQQNDIYGKIKHLKAPKIFISHGVEEISFPIGNLDYYIAISEETQQMMKEYNCQAEIIRNSIDCERFKPIKEINKNLKEVMFLSNHLGNVNIISMACSILGVNLRIIGGKYNNTLDIEKEINEVDLVISLGRGIYEAMSCGRAAFIYDKNGGDGMVSINAMEELRKNNCSGRRFSRKYTPEQLAKELKQYNFEMGKNNRNYILNNNNVVKNIDRFEEIIIQLSNSKDIEWILKSKLNRKK